MTTLVTLTGDVADLIGGDFDARRTKVWIEANVDRIFDNDNDTVRLGTASATVATDGTFTFVDLIATNSAGVNPTGFQYQIVVDYARAGGDRRRVQERFGWYSITADSDLTELAEAEEAPPTWQSAFTASMEGIRDEAEGHASDAAASAAYAEAVAGADTADDLITVLDANPASDFRVQQDARLSATYVSAVVMKGAGIDPTGATDSTTAMNAMLASAVALGAQAVHIPPGTYKCALVIPHPAQRVGLKIIGSGVGHTVLKAASASPVVTVGDADPVFDTQHVTMEHITIDGNSTAVSCVKMNHTRFFKLWDADLKGSTTYGLHAVGDLANYFAHFLRVRFFTPGINVYLDGGSAGIGGNSNYFEKCHFGGSTNANYNGAGVAIAVAINGGDSNIFQDCEFVALGTAIYLHNSAVGNKIIANQFDGTNTAVDCASAGVQRTHILDNTGTVNITDNGTATVIRQDYTLAGGTNGVMIGGTLAKTNVTPLRVRQHATNSGDAFRVEKSDASTLFKVDTGGNIETSSIGAVTAHGHSQFKNDANSSVSMTVDTGPTSAVANIGLRVRSRNSGQTANLQEWQNDAGTRMAAVGPKGEVKLASFATASRPTAASAGAGAVIYDSTLGLPIFSDGTNWKNFAGTAV